MRHFIYEVDERNLRVKLKDIELPLKEGAWESFDEFSGGQHKRSSEDGVKFKFSLNRNAVLLAVFATVIISFSLLLFNFISIKNPKPSAQLVPKPGVAPVATAIENPAPAPVKVVPAVVTRTVAVKAPEPVKQTPVAEPKIITPEMAPVVEKPAEAKAAPVEEVKADPEEIAREAARKAEEFEKRRQKREAAAMAKKIKPPVVTEDTEPDMRPE